MGLPTELLVEVFQSLDSIGRFRCHRVCPLWNTLLTTEAYFLDVRVSGHDADYGNLPYQVDDLYWAPACLLKCLRSTTKMVVITNLDFDKCKDIAELLNVILSRSRIPTLVLYDCWFGIGMAVMEPTAEVMECLADAVAGCRQCDRVMLKNCSICDDQLRAAVGQHSFIPQAREVVAMQLWDLFERCLVLKRPLIQPVLAEWIADCVAHKRNEQLEKHIIPALNTYQRIDPRPSTHYRHRKWTVSSISELDASKMTTLTAAALNEGIDL
ncbi:uncharacterized protein LOC129599095 [Paramacrobiotus metropolitanus]|uniref:uncharacterized protein LOC129599095 n=1 Tax=Paramacrobiotus metropolitanus TaxID=2943436 RepID=UPI002445AE59|nr:uncharacterized protein LOC129599095 [Paramacrobiotus metropolitanus]